jgi:hypothetical protein
MSMHQEKLEMMAVLVASGLVSYGPNHDVAPELLAKRSVAIARAILSEIGAEMPPAAMAPEPPPQVQTQ